MVSKQEKLANQSGQVVIILLLVMVLALAVGLSVIGRSVSEISTSTKTEESSRAFSAAEAGLEKVLEDYEKRNPPPGGNIELGSDFFNNQAQAEVVWSPELPLPGVALEYPPFGKTSFAQFWLADPKDLSGYYEQGAFNIYFGDPAPFNDQAYYVSNPGDAPAIEVSVIVYNPMNHNARRFYYDSYAYGRDGTRQSNGFKKCVAGGNSSNPEPLKIKTNNFKNADRAFYCQVRVPPSGEPPLNSGGAVSVMARVRMLYSELSHPIALEPIDGSLPPQARVFTSSGSAGSTQRRLQVFQQTAVMPQFFDFALFSAGTLDK